MDDGEHLAAALAGLTRARVRLYEVFARAPRPARMEGCPHCVAPGDGDCLLDGPVTELAPGVLDRYAAKALTTWGGPAEFRYFLPRLLDCVVADAVEFPDPEVVLGKLALAEWTTWPDDEIAAVHDFLIAWWTLTSHREPTRPDVDSVLCALAVTGSDLREPLRIWGRLETEAAVVHLNDLVQHHVRWGPEPRLTNAFWPEQGYARGAVLGWLTRGEAQAAVRSAFQRETREPVLELLAAIEPWVTPPDPPPPPKPLEGEAAQTFVAGLDADNRRHRAVRFARARVEGQARGKDPFDLRVLETICDTTRERSLNTVETQATLEEMYYVEYPDVMTLAQFAERVNELNRWS